MRNFKLNLATCPTNRLPEAAELERKFQSVRANNLLLPLSILQTNRLQSLALTKTKINKQLLADTLEMMQGVKSLNLYEVHFTDESKGIEVAPKELKKLSELKLRLSDIEILELISTTMVKHACFYTLDSSTEEYRQIDLQMNFIKDQLHLESLELKGKSIDCITQPENESFAMKLRELRISHCPVVGMGDDLWRFLFSQRKSLDVLSLQCKVTDQLLTSIINEMPRLRVLRIPGRYTLQATLQNLKTAKNIKSLSLFTFPDKLNDAISLMKLFPSLTQLDVELSISFKWFDVFIMKMLTMLPKLEAISLPYFLPKFSFSIVFPHLTEFSIPRIYDESFFNNFIKSHAKTLKKLTIKHVDAALFSRGMSIDAIKFCDKLERVEFGSDSPMVARMFKKVRRSYAWTLVIKFNEGENESRIVLKFPDDNAVWYEDFSFGDDEMIREIQTDSNYGLNAFINRFR